MKNHKNEFISKFSANEIESLLDSIKNKNESPDVESVIDPEKMSNDGLVTGSALYDVYHLLLNKFGDSTFIAELISNDNSIYLLSQEQYAKLNIDWNIYLNGDFDENTLKNGDIQIITTNNIPTISVWSESQSKFFRLLIDENITTVFDEGQTKSFEIEGLWGLIEFDLTCVDGLFWEYFKYMNDDEIIFKKSTPLSDSIISNVVLTQDSINNVTIIDITFQNDGTGKYISGSTCKMSVVAKL